MSKSVNYDSPARVQRTNDFHDYLQRYPCEFQGRTPTHSEQAAWEQRLGDWFNENSSMVDAEDRP